MAQQEAKKETKKAGKKEDTAETLTVAGREWIRQHDTRYDDLWVVIVTAGPDGSAGLVAGNAAEVA